MKKRSLLTTRDVAFAAVLAALSIVANSFSINTGTFSISFSYTVCFMAGHFFGPLVGAIVGVVGDTIGCVVQGYAPNPLISVGSILVGLLPGLVQWLSKVIKVPPKWYAAIWIVASYLLVYVVVTVFWNTFALWFSFIRSSGKSYWMYMAGRLPLQTVVWAINLGITFVLYPIASRLLHVKPQSLWERIPAESRARIWQAVGVKHVPAVWAIAVPAAALLVVFAVGLGICLSL